MKLFIGSLFFSFFLLSGYAQTKTTITGKVVDISNNQPLEYSSITIINKQTKKIVNGCISDVKGAFKVDNVPIGTYKVTVDFIGYKQVIIDSITISNHKQNFSLGIISLNPTDKNLQEVTITANGPVTENKIDKIVYNLANDVTSKGGIAIDVLKKVPQVTVDIDGNVELQGNSNIRFLINGKPSSVFGNSITDALASIPASEIKSVEAITSPGAKYDAQGTGGIINIILKENRMQGVNGNVSLSAGSRLENGSVNLNLRHNNFGVNVFFSGNAQLTSKTPNFQDRLSTDTSAKTTTHLIQNGYSNFFRNSYQSGIGFDWNITKQDNLTASLSYHDFSNHNEGLTNQAQLTQDFLGNKLPIDSTIRNFENQTHVYSVDWDLNYTKKFKKEGQELSIMYTASYGKPNSDYIQTQKYPEQFLPYTGLTSNNPGIDRETEISINYTQPVNDNFIVETGAKTIMQNISSNANVFNLDTVTRQYFIDPSQSYQLSYTSKVYAGYLSTTFSLSDFLKIKAGLRYEYTDVKIDFPNAAIPSYGNFVPSLILSHDFKGKKQSVKLAYSHRIERPEYRQLNPFMNLSDPYNISTGNPLLKPELGHNIELGYSNNFGNGGNIYIALFERINTQDLKSITTFYPTYQIGDSVYNNVSLTNIQNTGVEYNSGLNMSGSLPIMDGLNLRSNVMISQRHSVTTLSTGNVNMGIRYRINLNATYQVSRSLVFEVFGNYNSAAKNVQGRNPQSFNYTIAFSKQFWNKKASFGFTATNPFNQYISQKTTIATDNYSSYNIRKVPYRSFGINFSYKFGKLEFKKTKEDDNYLNAPPSLEN